MTSKINLQGLKLGRLTVIKENGRSNYGGVIWQCKCDCGNICDKPSGGLKSGRTKSCGCLHKETAIKNQKPKITHGLSNCPAYYSWAGMIQRCDNPKSTPYRFYGGRGIKVCKRWYKFENFYKDLGDRPKGYTLDRIDYNGDYKPSNCRWATTSEQAYNKRKYALESIPLNEIIEELHKRVPEYGLSAC